MIAYIPAILNIALIFGLLGLALNLQWGRTGIINFGHVAFFAIGAYTTAILTTKFDVPVVIGVIAGTLASAAAAVPIGWVTLRLKEDYLAIVTLGMAEAIRILIENNDWLGSTNGITGVPRPFGEMSMSSFNFLWLLILTAVTVIFVLLLRSITESQFGRVLRAIKSDEAAASILGKNVAAYKSMSLVIGSSLAGTAGAIYAHYVGFIAPDQFLALVTFYVWAGIVIGGSAHWGALLGTTLLIAAFEATRFLGDLGFDLFSGSEMAHIRLIVVGLAIVLFLRFRRNGLWPYNENRSYRDLARREGQPQLSKKEPHA